MKPAKNVKITNGARRIIENLEHKVQLLESDIRFFEQRYRNSVLENQMAQKALQDLAKENLKLRGVETEEPREKIVKEFKMRRIAERKQR